MTDRLEGYIKKASSKEVRKTYKMKWFSQKREKLLYFASRTANEAKDSFYFAEIVCVKEGAGLEFTVQLPKKTLFLCAMNEEDRKMWVGGLNKWKSHYKDCGGRSEGIASPEDVKLREENEQLRRQCQFLEDKLGKVVEASKKMKEGWDLLQETLKELEKEKEEVMKRKALTVVVHPPPTSPLGGSKSEAEEKKEDTRNEFHRSEVVHRKEREKPHRRKGLLQSMSVETRMRRDSVRHEEEKVPEYSQVINEANTIQFEELEFGEEIGSGTYSTIYRGLYRQQKVAIKQLRVAVLVDDYESTFKTEAALLGALKHANVVQFVGVVTFPAFYIITEYCENGSLLNILHNKKEEVQVPWSKVLSIATNIADGMLYLHNFKPRLIHRDLKPDNAKKTLHKIGNSISN